MKAELLSNYFSSMSTIDDQGKQLPPKEPFYPNLRANISDVVVMKKKSWTNYNYLIKGKRVVQDYSNL
jgi:hypothetical protein